MTPLNLKAFKNFKGQICPASVVGGGHELRYVVDVVGTKASFRVLSKKRAIYKGDDPVEAAEAFNRELAKTEAKKAKKALKSNP